MNFRALIGDSHRGGKCTSTYFFAALQRALIKSQRFPVGVGVAGFITGFLEVFERFLPVFGASVMVG
jgi:uncharacterized membrane protein